MASVRNRKLERLFDALLGLDTAQRSDLLQRECADDPDMRAELQALLAAAERSSLELDVLGAGGPDDGLCGQTVPAGEAPVPGLEPFPLQRGATFGQYELIRELGSGGMGAVYLARDTWLGRRVAIKFLSHDDPSLAERFIAEARATARCKHDNIVDIYDIGEARGYSYMVLEYLEGTTLRAWLSEHWQPSASRDPDATPQRTGAAASAAPRPVSAARAIDLVVPVVRALAHAHALGMVHRDLKPENIMLTDSGSVKVLDFGLAKVLDQQTPLPQTNQDFLELWDARGFRTRAGVLMGTMPYMSPEQWGADEVDARTDVWAAGILLWELVTGRHPARSAVARAAPVGARSRTAHATVGRRARRRGRARRHRRSLPEEAQGRAHAVGRRAPRRARAIHARPGRPRRRRRGPERGPIYWPRGVPGGRRLAVLRPRPRDRPIAHAAAPSPRRHGDGRVGRGQVVAGASRRDPGVEALGRELGDAHREAGPPAAGRLADVLAQVVRASGDDGDAMPTAGARQALIDTLRRQPGYLGAVLRLRCRKHHGRILLFVDQFEELYTLGTGGDTRAAFIACLEGVADDASSPLRLVLSVRADFLDRVADDRAFSGELSRGLVFLPGMAREGLRQALLRPSPRPATDSRARAWSMPCSMSWPPRARPCRCCSSPRPGCGRRAIAGAACWRSARTARASSPAPPTRRRGCGMPTEPGHPSSFAGMRSGLRRRRSAQTVLAPSLLHRTGLSGSGTSTAPATRWSSVAPRA